MAQKPKPKQPAVPEPVEGFAIVLRDDDRRLHRHTSIESATKEAERLAENLPGHRFYVLMAISAQFAPVFVTAERVRTPARPPQSEDDDIPF